MSIQLKSRKRRIAVYAGAGGAVLAVAVLAGAGVNAGARVADSQGSGSVAASSSSSPSTPADGSPTLVAEVADIAVAVAVATTVQTGDGSGNAEATTNAGPLVDLRVDLAAVRRLAPGDRVPALQAIKKGLLDGDYGVVLQRVAERVASEGGLPAELRADLVQLRTLPAAERPAALADIRDTARDGGYGPWVEAIADWLALRSPRW